MVHSFASLERMRKEMGTKQFTKLVGEELIPSRTGMATEALKHYGDMPKEDRPRVFILDKSPSAPKPEEWRKIGFAAYQDKLDKWKAHREKKNELYKDKVAAHDASKESSKSTSRKRKGLARSSSGSQSGKRKGGRKSRKLTRRRR
jgi:hypothetical protein